MTEPTTRLQTAFTGRYNIVRELGAGGMATVYLADDVKHGRSVAVKVLRPELAAALGPDRFPREIRILARLQHPHILPLHDSGEVDGFLFYTMPFVDGESLRERIDREGALPVQDTVRIMREVADALSSAHAAGVLHRDIKPANVMLSGRHALVMDFGVAKAVRDAGGETLTTVGVAVGTPTYMSPEQATGAENLDQRSDIYALGVMAYEMLTGRPPFTAKTAAGVLSAHVLEKPVPIRTHRPSVPPRLEELVMRCLEKEPADRWQSAEELILPLESLSTPSGGTTPTTTRPVKVVAPSSAASEPAVPTTQVPPSAMAKALIAAVTLLVVAVAAFGVWKFVGSGVSALRAIDPQLRESAGVLGAGPWRRVRDIDLALTGRALLLAAGFSFAISLGEFGATTVLARADTPTISVAIGRFLGRPGAASFGQAAAMSVILLGVTAVVAVASQRGRVSDLGRF